MSRKIITQVKDHILLYVSIIALGISIYFAVTNRTLAKQVTLLEADRDVTQTQIATLFLSMEDRDRMTLLDKEIIKFPAMRDKLPKEVPTVSKKILDLHYRYEPEGLKGNIILGVIEVESNFTHDIISYAETGQPMAYGLMQLIPSTANMLLRPRGLTWSKEVLFNPTFNIELGTELLHMIHSSYIERGLEKKDEFNLTLATYNAGERAVLEYYFANKKLPPRSRDYVAKVNMARRKWILLGF